MATPDPNLQDLAVRGQVYLERLKAGLSKSTSETLSELGTVIVDIVKALDVENLAELNRGQLKSLLGEVRTAQTEVMMKALDEIIAQMPDVGDHAASFEVSSLDSVLAGQATVTGLEVGAAYRAALKEPIAATGELLNSFLKNWSEKEVTAVSNLISQGYANGWTNAQMIQAVRGTKKAGYTDGILARMDRNANAVVHTAVQHVASESRFAVWDANRDIVKGYRLIATLDGRTTVICRSLDRSRVFLVNQGPRPPLHIKCRTTTIAVLAPKFDYLEEGAMRSSETGPVSAKDTYYDWLKTQPVNFQNDALGPMRGKLFREGGLSTEEFARLNLGSNFQPLTLKEMKALAPNAFEKAGVLKN